MTALPDVVEELDDSFVAFLWNFLQQLVRQSIVTAGGRNLVPVLFLCISIDTLCDALQLVVRLSLDQVTYLLDMFFALFGSLSAAEHSSVQYETGFLVGFLDGLKTGTYFSATYKMAPVTWLQLVATSS